jgi:hypothetical protein
MTEHPEPLGQASRRACVLASAAAALGLGACASRPLSAGDGWHEVRLPGKASTRWRSVRKDGREATEAVAERSASMWRRRLTVPAQDIASVEFSWWVPELLPLSDVADAEREDAVVRVVFGFAGDESRLSARNRMMFDLAEALSGERLPFASLMYVWERQAPVGSVVVNPRTDRVRKLVVDSGPSQLGRWRDHRRRLRDDFQRVFGEAPGPLTSVAFMTDSDNTGQVARAWYGPLRLLP